MSINYWQGRIYATTQAYIISTPIKRKIKGILAKLASITATIFPYLYYFPVFFNKSLIRLVSEPKRNIKPYLIILLTNTRKSLHLRTGRKLLTNPRCNCLFLLHLNHLITLSWPYPIPFAISVISQGILPDSTSIMFWCSQQTSINT